MIPTGPLPCPFCLGTTTDHEPCCLEVRISRYFQLEIAPVRATGLGLFVADEVPRVPTLNEILTGGRSS